METRGLGPWKVFASGVLIVKVSGGIETAWIGCSMFPFCVLLLSAQMDVKRGRSDWEMGY